MQDREELLFEVFEALLRQKNECASTILSDCGIEVSRVVVRACFNFIANSSKSLFALKHELEQPCERGGGGLMAGYQKREQLIA